MKLLCLLVLISTTLTTFAHASDAEMSFSTGLQRLQENKLEEAKTLFEQSLQSAPQSTATLYNLGLTEYRLGKPGLALALWRKALSIGGSDPTIKEALDFGLSKLSKKELSRKSDLFETLRAGFLVEFNLFASLSLLAATLALFGLSFIHTVSSRKKAFNADETAPPIGWKTPVTFLAFVAAVVITGLKYVEITEARATVLEKSIEVRAAPDLASPGLFEIFEGLEVIVLERRNDWLRVRYPGGRSGWLPESALMQTAGSPL
jgi:tetratricopeptide (TPR) repeat protein